MKPERGIVYYEATTFNKHQNMSRSIVFNLTIKMSGDDSAKWIQLMTKQVLPSCTDGKVILSSDIKRIMTAQEDGDHSFAVQFVYASQELFIQQKLPTMRRVLEAMDEQFRGRYVYFATMMELIHQQK